MKDDPTYEVNEKAIAFLLENGWHAKGELWTHPRINDELQELETEAALDIQRSIRDAKADTPFERLMSVLESINDSLESISGSLVYLEK